MSSGEDSPKEVFGGAWLVKNILKLDVRVCYKELKKQFIETLRVLTKSRRHGTKEGSDLFPPFCVHFNSLCSVGLRVPIKSGRMRAEDKNRMTCMPGACSPIEPQL
jgi:hypothetical protein